MDASNTANDVAVRFLRAVLDGPAAESFVDKGIDKLSDYAQHPSIRIWARDIVRG